MTQWQSMYLTEKQWNDLVRFEKRLKGTGGQVTIPTADFRALMDAVRQFGSLIAEHVGPVGEPEEVAP